MADRPYESIALYNGNEGEGKTQYSVRYNGLSKPLPWLQPQNGDGKELSKPAGSVFPILLEIVLCAVAVCFIGMFGDPVCGRLLSLVKFLLAWLFG